MPFGFPRARSISTSWRHCSSTSPLTSPTWTRTTKFGSSRTAPTGYSNGTDRLSGVTPSWQRARGGADPDRFQERQREQGRLLDVVVYENPLYLHRVFCRAGERWRIPWRGRSNPRHHPDAPAGGRSTTVIV